MFKYLEKILGKPMKYYQTLMASKSENANITDAAVNKVAAALEPHVIKAHAFTLLDKEIKKHTYSESRPIPQNKKGNDLSDVGTFLLSNQLLTLYIDLDASHKNKLTYQYITEETSKVSKEVISELQSIVKRSHQSLPIWEEVVHRFPEVSQLIVDLNPKHPWTLYKKALLEFNCAKEQVILGGYPQWRINDVDFRKIKPLEFLMEYRLDDKGTSLYFFRNSTTSEIEIIEQKI